MIPLMLCREEIRAVSKDSTCKEKGTLTEGFIFSSQVFDRERVGNTRQQYSLSTDSILL